LKKLSKIIFEIITILKYLKKIKVVDFINVWPCIDRSQSK
jgi:hypothetical protein